MLVPVLIEEFVAKVVQVPLLFDLHVAVIVSESASLQITYSGGVSGVSVLSSWGDSPVCVGLWFVVNWYHCLVVQFPSVALTYQV